MVDLSTANGVIKIVGGKLTKQYEEVALLHNRFQKGKGKKIGDRGIEIPTHLGGNYNHKFMTDGGKFPTGGGQISRRAKAFFKNLVGACRLTGGAIDSINSGDVAYVTDVLQWNLDESMNALYKMGNIYAHGVGNARLATISSGATSATQTVSNTDANRFLRDGVLVDFVVPGTGVVTGTGRILNANASSTTFTLESSATSNTGDYVVASGSFNLGLTGKKAMIDDTSGAPVTFQTINRNTYPGYRSYGVNAGSTGFDVAYLRKAMSAGIHIKVGELDRDALEIWSHPCQAAAYNALGWQLKRFSGESKTLDLGYTQYEFETINWTVDVDCDKDRIDLIDFSTIQKYVTRDFGWDEKTGSILHQCVDSDGAFLDQYEAFLVSRYNYGCTRPNKNAFVYGLTVPSGY